jgi:hypothetical protein
MTPKYRMLDLFCGRLGWSKAFLARGWDVIGIDLTQPPEIPEGFKFFNDDVLEVTSDEIYCWEIDFICASSPCEEFSVHGMKHFHPNPKYPENGIRLFNHTREICEASGVPYVMENVRTAQQFVGRAAQHCGPFYLWGSGVPPIMPQGIVKGLVLGGGGAVLKMIANGATRADIKEYRRKHDEHWNSSGSEARKKSTAMFATIPPELSNAVADYAERLLEQKQAGIVACHERSGSGKGF